MKLISAAILFWTTLLFAINQQKPTHWTTLNGHVTALSGKHTFTLNNEISVRCSNNTFSIGDSLQINGVMKSSRKRTFKAHLITQNDSIYYRRDLGNIDTITVPEAFQHSEEQKYLYKYSQKLQTQSRASLFIGSILTTSSITVGIIRNNKRETAYTNKSTTPHKNIKTITPIENENDIGTLIIGILDELCTNISNEINIGLTDLDYQLAESSDAIIFTTLSLTGTTLIINGIIKHRRHKKLHISPNRSLNISIEPGGTLKMPGIFFVGRF